MFGLLYLLWLALILVLVVQVFRSLKSMVRDANARKQEAGRLATFVFLLVIVTWPFGAGRAVFEIQCQGAGLRIDAVVDLREDGYLILRYIPAVKPNTPSVPADNQYDHQAVQDLLMGRIGYFEKALFARVGTVSDTATRSERFTLGDARDRHCLDSVQAGHMLDGLGLPQGICLKRTELLESRAAYHLTLAGGKSKQTIDLVHAASGTTKARYRAYSHWSGAIASAGEHRYQCPARSESFDHAPLKGLTAFVLLDRNGEVATSGQLADWYGAVRGAGGYRFRELPPREITGQPTTPGSNR